jgi:hypothetical protein
LQFGGSVGHSLFAVTVPLFLLSSPCVQELVVAEQAPILLAPSEEFQVTGRPVGLLPWLLMELL